jgi:AraC-like DNA-binding protein/tetratricopeptide (TPR) repeat protein/TolB-like protein
MSEPLSMDQALIRKLTDIVLANLQDENFGVEKLAEIAGLSRFTIHRKIKSIKQQDVSQFIREVRLQRGREMLQNNEGTIAEIAFRVGFNSPAYFTKCFHEHYGYTPGKVKDANLMAQEETLRTHGIVQSKREKRSQRTVRVTFSGIAILALLVIFFIYPKIFRTNPLERFRMYGKRISIAVMPFQNMTNDTTRNYWEVMIQYILISQLTNLEDELEVRQGESINSYIKGKGFTDYASITPSVAGTISKKLSANVYICGSIIQETEKIRMTAQLVDSRSTEPFKSFQIDGTPDHILQIIDSLSVMIRDFLIISKLEKEISPEFGHYASSTTTSPEAFRNFILGNNAFSELDFQNAAKYLLEAVKIDSNFSFAMLRLIPTYGNLGLFEEAKKWCLRAYNKKDQMPLLSKLWAIKYYSALFETPYEDIKCLKQILKFDDQSPRTYYELGRVYSQGLYQYDKAIPEFEKALEIYEKWDSKPFLVSNYTFLGESYHKTGHYKKERKLYRKAEKDFPDNSSLISRETILALSEGRTKDANDYIEKYISIRKENSVSPATIAASLAFIYREANILEKAEEYYRQAYSFDSINPLRLNSLAYFLIDKDRNINEGMELIEKALVLKPDDYQLLKTKGWGLYKQGKYKEALEILQKSWDLLLEKANYNPEAFLQLEAAKKAVAGHFKF